MSDVRNKDCDGDYKKPFSHDEWYKNRHKPERKTISILQNTLPWNFKLYAEKSESFLMFYYVSRLLKKKKNSFTYNYKVQ